MFGEACQRFASATTGFVASLTTLMSHTPPLRHRALRMTQWDSFELGGKRYRYWFDGDGMAHA